jgi:hypothetical protein
MKNDMKHDGKQWLEPVLKQHLPRVQAPEDAWRQMRSAASAARQETRWSSLFMWPAVAAGLILLVAAGGHSYFKAAADSGSLAQAANPVLRGESNALTLRALAPNLKLEVQTTCRLCHTTAQL